MSGSQVDLYTTLVELIRFDKNEGVHFIHSHTIENRTINGEKKLKLLENPERHKSHIK